MYTPACNKNFQTSFAYHLMFLTSPVTMEELPGVGPVYVKFALIPRKLFDCRSGAGEQYSVHEPHIDI